MKGLRIKYGPPSTQKTLIIHQLAKALRIYNGSSMINDWSGLDEYFNLWCLDEYYEADAPEGSEKDQRFFFTKQQEEAVTNTLLRLLDGQTTQLNAKYRPVFEKNNVPIILMGNTARAKIKDHSLQARLFRLEFKSSHTFLDPDRFIMTLWGCIKRRIFSVKPEMVMLTDAVLFKQIQVPLHISLKYNEQVLTSNNYIMPIDKTFLHLGEFIQKDEESAERQIPHMRNRAHIDIYVLSMFQNID